MEKPTVKTKYRSIFAVLLTSSLVTAANIVPVNAATPGERAKCEEMFKQMGEKAPHDHGAEKRGAPGAMKAQHARCKEIMDMHGESSKQHHDKMHKDDAN